MAEKVADRLSKAISREHNQSWYIDFKNEKIHYIIFPGKIFRIDRGKKEEYEKAQSYGLKLGIPYYQLDFSRNVII